VLVFVRRRLPGSSTADVAYAIPLTLATRPVGALIFFGWLADRHGRRIPLMINVVFYSVVEVLSGLAPDDGWRQKSATPTRSRWSPPSSSPSAVSARR
jgi:MFS family permease